MAPCTRTDTLREVAGNLLCTLSNAHTEVAGVAPCTLSDAHMRPEDGRASRTTPLPHTPSAGPAAVRSLPIE